MFSKLFCVFLAAFQSDETIFSGPQVGETLVPFTVSLPLENDATHTLCPVSETNEKPQLLVFMHEKTRPAFGVSNILMKLAAARGAQKLDSAMIYLSEDPSEASAWMKNVANNFPKGVRIGISPDGIEGPEAYGLNRKVAVTVLVAKGDLVTANFAMVQPSVEVDVPTIFKAIAEVLGEETVPKVSDFMPQAQRARMAQNAPNQSEQQDPKLRPLLVPLIQKTATDEEVASAARKIEEYAKENPVSRIQIGDIARRIIAADKLENYGTAACQQYLTKWSKEFVADAANAKPSEANNEAPTKKPTRDK